jgi:hypothetical protein
MGQAIEEVRAAADHVTARCTRTVWRRSCPGGSRELPTSVTTERLTLDLISLDEAVRIRAGHADERWHPDYPRQDDRDAVSMIRSDDPWGCATSPGLRRRRVRLDRLLRAAGAVVRTGR